MFIKNKDFFLLGVVISLIIISGCVQKDKLLSEDGGAMAPELGMKIPESYAIYQDYLQAIGVMSATPRFFDTGTIEATVLSITKDVKCAFPNPLGEQAEEPVCVPYPNDYAVIMVDKIIDYVPYSGQVSNPSDQPASSGKESSATSEGPSVGGSSEPPSQITGGNTGSATTTVPQINRDVLKQGQTVAAQLVLTARPAKVRYGILDEETVSQTIDKRDIDISPGRGTVSQALGGKTFKPIQKDSDYLIFTTKLVTWKDIIDKKIDTSEKILPGLNAGDKFRATIKYDGTIVLDEYTIIVSSVKQAWIKHSGNPVMIGRANTTWYDMAVADPAVIYDNGIYKMYYTASGLWPASINPKDANVTRAGYATSKDGINWDRSIGKPVLDIGNKSKNDWDSHAIETVWVLKDSNDYKMYYVGYSKPDRTDAQIGLATSKDGINWIKKSSPILNKTPTISWEAFGIWGPVVLKEDGIYKMWYLGVSNIDGKGRLGYATSTDGINFARHSANPVLNLSSSGEWDSEYISDFGIIKASNKYYLLYSGSNDSGVKKKYNIGMATSADGITWVKFSNNPVIRIGELGSWEEFAVMAPSLLLEDGVIKIWYHGVKNNYTTDPFAWNVGFATARIDDI